MLITLLRCGGDFFWLFQITRIFCNDGTIDNFCINVNKLSTRSYVNITAVNPWDFGAVNDRNNGFCVDFYKKILLL